ncbi:MAG: hypothetical protein HC936_18165 [Leptolyngbyaceae cyanobacterium SU_3_3]|nr:hypothetical protein [Leptolyngbyaceae cyanobacterium SU_3_3]
MITWAFIFEAPETNPKTDRMVIERGGMRSIVVAVPEQPAVVQAAVDLVAEGAQFIELCGGFEPTWAGKVIEATNGKIPVGTVGYAGGQSVLAMAKIVSA